MNILVVGRGWVGRKIFDQFVINGHVVTLAPHYKAFDAVRNCRYDWVVNCAGLTGSPNVDACESNKQETMSANAIFPIRLFEECSNEGIRLAHFSSGCIYEGRIEDEYADPNFFGSTYSISKGVSDLLLKDKCLIFRVRLPFSGEYEPKNLLYKLYNYAKNGKLVDGGLNSITDIDEAVEHAVDLVERDANGPYNLVNWDPINTHDIVEMMGIEAEWFTDEEFKHATAARRSNCVIPAYEKMSPVAFALSKRIAEFKEQL